MKLRFWMSAVLVSAPVFVPMLMASAIVTPAASSEKQIPVSFIRRIMGFGSRSSQLWLGQLPEKLPVELPLPPDAQLLGSETRRDRFVADVIHLNSQQSPAQVQAFYQATLPRLGWQQRQWQEWRPIQSKPTKRTGNSSSSQPIVSKTPAQTLYFCHALKKTALEITTTAVVNVATEVKLTIRPSGESVVCQSPQQQDREWEQASEQMLTQLKIQLEKLKLFRIAAPPGSEEFPLGSDLGGTLIRSSLDPHRFAEHYSGLMRLAGWQYQNSGKDRNFFWSTWTLKATQDDPLLAQLLIVVEPGLPEIRLFQDERGQVPGLNQAIFVASRTAALPIAKNRQYLVSLSLFDLGQKDRPLSSTQVRRRRSPLPSTSPNDTQTISESLALRFLCGFPGQLFPNQLPPQLPLQIPVPASAQLIGSWVIDEADLNEINNLLLFNIPQAAETVQEFYAKQGQALRWSSTVGTDSALSNVGFLETSTTFQFNPVGDGEAYIFLCDRAKGTEIVLQTYATSPTTTEFRADVRPNSTNCIESDTERKEDAKFRESLEAPKKGIPIPILVPPADTQVDQASESTLSMFYAQSAQITSKTLDSNGVFQHYEAQLQQQGWRSQARYVTELSRWSHWRFTDKKGDQWHALLKFTKPQLSDQVYSAELILLKNSTDQKR